MKQLDNHDPYHILFLEETLEQIEAMEQALLDLENGGDDIETLHHLFRMAHSLKGSAATLELEEMKVLAHHLEGLMTCLKDGSMPLTEGLMDLMLGAVDGFKKIHAFLSGQSKASPELESFITQLTDYIAAGYCPAWKNPPAQSLKKTGNTEDHTALGASTETGSMITITFDEHAELKSVKSYMVIQELETLGAVSVITPIDYEQLEDEAFGEVLQLWLACVCQEASILKALEDLSELNTITVKSRGSAGNTQHSDRESNRQSPRSSVSEAPQLLSPPSAPIAMTSVQHQRIDEQASVRVSVHKINQLINLVGELIIDKESLNRICKELGRTYKKNSSVQRLQELQEHIHYLGSELQEIALSTRMLPLETIFNKFPRMVRDLSKRLDKQVEFIVEGKETGIDRGMIESLVDPLTHLLRNALDHGIDSREERANLGKPEIGTIRLSASHGESHVVITLEDDGGGMDPLKIKAKALEKGLISEEESSTMSREDLLNCIFKPGFSTAAVLSDVSGRGVGLDVVKANITKLNGMIDVWTKEGEGTRFTIKIPLTLAIINAMLIKEGAFVFAIPMGSVIEVLRLTGTEMAQSVHQTGNTEMLVWREANLPLIRLKDYFETGESTESTDATDSAEKLNEAQVLEDLHKSSENKVYLAVVGHGEKKMALKIERILGEQEVVIKSLGEFKGKNRLLGELKGISGVSILGDGSFAHIIDVATISRHER